MVKWKLYAIAGVALAAISAGIWWHGYGHGIEVERGRNLDAVAKARAQDAEKIEALRKELKKRRRQVARTAEVIRNVQDDTPCQCFDVPAPDHVIDSMLKTYNALFRSEADGALLTCRIPLNCEPPYVYSGPRRAMGDHQGMRRPSANPA